MNNRIAIVCDWLIDFGGAELVISHLLEMYPEADIYTSVCYMKHPMLEGRRVYTSWIQRIPFLNRRHKLAGILRPWAFRSFDLTGYDIVLCSSSAESKQVAMGKWRMEGRVKNEEGRDTQKEVEQDFSTRTLVSDRNDGSSKLGTVNFELSTQKPKIIVYCHTPTRYYWSHATEYEDMMEFGIMNPLVKAVFRLVKGWMQRVDYEAAQRVDHFIANSENTRERIKTYYKRESTVIYPGVDTEKQSTINTTGSENFLFLLPAGSYYLGIGRCIPYKKFDLLVDTFNANGRNLILCTSTDTAFYRELRARSKSNIIWRFGIGNEEKMKLMQHARAFLFPPEEDFGLVTIEAMALGIPVIAYGRGGALETVIDGETGLFFTPQTPEALDATIEKLEGMTWDRKKIQEHAKQFSKKRFQEEILSFIETHD